MSVLPEVCVLFTCSNGLFILFRSAKSLAPLLSRSHQSTASPYTLNPVSCAEALASLSLFHSPDSVARSGVTAGFRTAYQRLVDEDGFFSFVPRLIPLPLVAVIALGCKAYSEACGMPYLMLPHATAWTP